MFKMWGTKDPPIAVPTPLCEYARMSYECLYYNVCMDDYPGYFTLKILQLNAQRMLTVYKYRISNGKLLPPLSPSTKFNLNNIFEVKADKQVC